MAKATQSVVSGLLFAGHFTGQCGNATAKAEQSKQSVGRFNSSSVMVSHFTGQCENALAVGHTRPQRLLVNPPTRVCSGPLTRAGQSLPQGRKFSPTARH